MKRTIISIFILCIASSAFSQDVKDMVTFNYNIVVTKGIQEVTKMKKNDKEEKKSKKERKEELKNMSLGDMLSTDEPKKTYYVDHSGKKTEYRAGSKLVASLIDTLYQMTRKEFKDSLNINLLPLNELKDDIRYDATYPACPTINSKRKAIRKTGSYDRYSTIYINFNTGTSVGVRGLTIGEKYPNVWIKINVYDEDKNKVKKISVKKDFNKDLGVSTVKHKWTQRKVYDLEIMRRNLSGLCNLTLDDVIKEYSSN